MTRPEAIVIGGSAGSVDALGRFFAAFKPVDPVPVAVVIHVPADSPGILHEVIAHHGIFPMKQAEDKEPLRAGTVYFAPPGYHLLIESDRSFALSLDEPVQYSRPSIDVLFESAADCYRERLLGILLTGGSEDGAAGLERIKRLGGVTLVQDPDDAEMPLMPAAAIKRCMPSHVAPLRELAGLAASQLGMRSG